LTFILNSPPRCTVLLHIFSVFSAGASQHPLPVMPLDAFADTMIEITRDGARITDHPLIQALVSIDPSQRRRLGVSDSELAEAASLQAGTREMRDRIRLRVAAALRLTENSGHIAFSNHLRGGLVPQRLTAVLPCIPDGTLHLTFLPT
jgi:hypothetical protein